MKSIKKITIVGHFGGKKIFSDGQTVKTKILYDELKKVPNFEIKKVDTYYKSKRPIKLLLTTFINIISTKDIILLLSGNGMRFYFPLCYFFAKIFKKNIYHDVIGGNLWEYVIKYPTYKKYLNSFKYNWVETIALKDKLKELGISNVQVIPNFKNLHVIDKEKIKLPNNRNYKFCTFSRVTEKKGITDAIYAVAKLNEIGYKCILDIYGPIDSEYEETFYKLLGKNKSCINYCGIISYNNSTNTLKKYDLLLFPTYWEGEGFPGTIVDAFSSGLPVVATDWNCNKEILSNYKTGIIYPNKTEKTLEDAIVKLLDDEKLLLEMKYNCINEAKKYVPSIYMKKIISYMEKSDNTKV